MATTHTGDLHVSGALFAGNIYIGSVWMRPDEDDTVTQVEVDGLNLRGSGPVRALATASTTVPWRRVREVSAERPTPEGTTFYAYRTNTTPFTVHYLLIREA